MKCILVYLNLYNQTDYWVWFRGVETSLDGTQPSNWACPVQVSQLHRLKFKYCPSSSWLCSSTPKLTINSRSSNARDLTSFRISFVLKLILPHSFNILASEFLHDIPVTLLHSLFHYAPLISWKMNLSLDVWDRPIKTPPLPTPVEYVVSSYFNLFLFLILYPCNILYYVCFCILLLLIVNTMITVLLF